MYLTPTRLVLAGALALSVFAAATARQSTAFIRDREVWLKTPRSDERQVTSTNGNIETLETSKSGKFAAAHKVVGSYRQERDIDDPKTSVLKPLYSILILDIEHGKVLAELKVSNGVTHPLGWRSDDTYLFGEGSVLDVHQRHQYDPRTGTTTVIR